MTSGGKARPLRSRIVIESVTRTTDSVGGWTESWAAFHTCWAHIQPVSSKEQLLGGRIADEITHKILVRYRAGVTAAMRVSFSGRIFQIKGLLNFEERGKWLWLLCREGVPS